MVTVVLEAPGLIGINERHEGNSPDNILQKFVSRKRLVGTVVADHEKLHPNYRNVICCQLYSYPVTLCNCIELWSAVKQG